MFDKPEDAMEWALKQGIVSRCPKHETLHDAKTECPQCSSEKEADAFKNVTRQHKTSHYSQIEYTQFSSEKKPNLFENVDWSKAKKPKSKLVRFLSRLFG